MLKYTQASGRNVKGENKPFINDCLIEVKTTSVNISSVQENEALIVDIKSKLDKKDIKKTGVIPIELENRIKALKRYGTGDEIKVTLKNGMVKFTRIKPRLETKSSTIDAENVKSHLTDDFPFVFKGGIWIGRKTGLKLDTYVKLDAKEFKEVVEDGEQIQYRSFPFTVSKKQVTVTVEDTNTGASILRELKNEEIKTNETIESLYSFGFGNAFGNLTGEIEIWLANEGPMVILKETDELKLVYMLATTETEPENDDDDDEGVTPLDPDNADNVDDELEEKLKESLENGEESG